MTDCELSQELISAWLDGEVTVEERESVESHLDRCDSCKAAKRRLSRAKRAARQISRRASLPPRLRAALERAAGRSAAKRRLAVGIIAVVTAAVLTGAILAWPASELGRRPHPSEEQALVEALVEDHVRYLRSESPVEIATGDPEEIERWFRGRLDFGFRAGHIPGCELVGARLCLIEGQRIALLFYEVDGRRLSFFALPAEEGAASEPWRCDWVRSGFRVCIETFDGVRYAIVADLPETRMLEFGADGRR